MNQMSCNWPANHQHALPQAFYNTSSAPILFNDKLFISTFNYSSSWQVMRMLGNGASDFSTSFDPRTRPINKYFTTAGDAASAISMFGIMFGVLQRTYKDFPSEYINLWPTSNRVTFRAST